uniref:Uncharacterized protein n=1 Tax=viral metagenome TaxID=1070528 RepID=A0A6C0LPT6_9ZZZZ
MENNINIEDVFKGILSGVFVSYLIILGMRPAAIYPDNILDIIDNPWIFLLLFILNYYVLMWDTTIGLLFFLTLIALILDIIIFTDGDFLKDNIYDMSEAFYGAGNNSAATATAAATNTGNTGNGKASAATTSYKDINDIILDKLRTMNL